jgi:hypothetical protein
MKNLLIKAGLVAGALAAVAVPVATSAASASAATVSTMSAPAPAPSYHRMPDQLKLTFQGNTYSYNVHLRTQWVAPGIVLVRGHLTDAYEPQAISLPVSGVIFDGNDVVFSVQYPATGPDAGNQGVRTFSGTIGLHGHVTGNWSETGSEAGSGLFTLDRI